MKIKLLAAMATLVVCVHSHAAYTAYIYQNGPNVVASGSGTLNLNGINFATAGLLTPLVHADHGILSLGASKTVSAYEGITGPSSFGIGFKSDASSSSGDTVGLQKSLNRLFLPFGYVSGSHLSSTATWNTATLASLGLTPGS